MGTLPPDPARPDDRGVIVLVQALRRKALDDDVATHASALTFTAFLSLFPLILLATSVLGFRLDARGMASIQQLVQTVPGLDQLIQNQAQTIVDGRFTAGLVGIVGLLWAASALSNRARRALGIVFEKPDTAIHRRLASLAITIVLGALLVAAVTAAGAISAFLHTHGLSTGWLVAQVGMLALLAAFFLVCYLLLVPGRQRVRDLVPAALVCAVGWTVLQGIGSWFVARQVAHWSALYGTIATVFGVLLFLRIAAWIFLAGAELAAALPRPPRELAGDQPFQVVQLVEESIQVLVGGSHVEPAPFNREHGCSEDPRTSGVNEGRRLALTGSDRQRHGLAWNDEPMADGKTSRATLETHEPLWRGERESSRGHDWASAADKQSALQVPPMD